MTSTRSGARDSPRSRSHGASRTGSGRSAIELDGLRLVIRPVREAKSG